MDRKKIKTYISVGYYNEEGAVKDYDYSRYNFRFNVDYDVTDWLKVKPQMSASRRDIMDQAPDVSVFYSLLPWDSPYDSHGDLVGFRPSEWVNSTGNNHMYDLQWNFEKTLAYEVMANLDFDVKLTDWLTFASVNSYRYINRTRKNYEDPRSRDGAGYNGNLDDKIEQSYRVYSNQLLRFNKLIDKHSISGVLAYEWNSYTFTKNESTVSGFGAGFTVADAAATPRMIMGAQEEYAVQSFLANVNYAYDHKYLAQVSFRRDGASNFGVNARYGNFYSLSAGWNVHREDFFTLDFVNQLKLRASYGPVGKRPEEYYPQYFLYDTQSYDEVPGGIITQIENKDLTWEKTYTTGLGLDLTLFERLDISLDYYNKNTSNLLYEVPLPSVTGLNKSWQNVGSVRNRGFEVTISYDVLPGVKDWDWSVSANLGLNRNQIRELYGDQPEIIVESGSGVIDHANLLLKPGMDMDTWYLTEWAGVDAQTGQPQWYMTNEAGERVITNDYGEASSHKVAVGTASPDFFGGFSTDLRYKDFDLSAFFSYSVGGKIYNYNRIEYDSDGAYNDRNQMKLQKGWSRWEKPGDIATHPQASYGNASGSNKGSSRHLKSGTYLKMKSLSFGYNFNLPSLQISNMRVYFSAENLFTITSFSGIDLELPPAYVAREDKYQITGVATSIYPQTRKFMFGVSLNF